MLLRGLRWQGSTEKYDNLISNNVKQLDSLLCFQFHVQPRTCVFLLVGTETPFCNGGLSATVQTIGTDEQRQSAAAAAVHSLKAISSQQLLEK